MIVPSRLTLALAGALALSLAGNVFLTWQWAQEGPECRAETAEDALTATQAAETAEDARDKTSAGITATAGKNASQTAAQVDSATQATQKDIHDAYFHHDPGPVAGPCVRVGPVPDGVREGIDEARSRANAAAGVLQAAVDAADPARPGKK